MEIKDSPESSIEKIKDSSISVFSKFVNKYKKDVSFILHDKTNSISKKIEVFFLGHRVMVGVRGLLLLGSLDNLYLMSLFTFNEIIAHIPFTLTTTKFYIKTKKHIKRFGTIKEDFFIGALGDESSGSLIGYCQLQGIYLAAKELDKLDIYYHLKKKYTANIIPNF